MQLTHAPGRLTGSRLNGPFDVPVDLWGFGGLHGGLAVALLVSEMGGHADVSTLRHVSAVFHHGVRDRIELSAEPVRTGSGIVTSSGAITGARGPLVTATAVFGPAQAPARVSPVPVQTGVGQPLDWDTFEVPREFVPFAAHTEIRPVGTALPFTGSPEPELTAWIRLVEDDTPPDVLRFLVLVDALAPSYAAVLTAPTPIPTIELSARPGDGLAAAASPWVLVRATTTATFGGGWLDEQLDVWGVDGAHLGSSHQLRLALRDSTG